MNVAEKLKRFQKLVNESDLIFLRTIVFLCTKLLWVVTYAKKIKESGEVALGIEKQKSDRYRCWEKLNERIFQSTKFLK